MIGRLCRLCIDSCTEYKTDNCYLGYLFHFIKTTVIPKQDQKVTQLLDLYQ